MAWYEVESSGRRREWSLSGHGDATEASRVSTSGITSCDISYHKFKADGHCSYGPNGRLRSTFSIPEWTKQPEVRQAWSELKEEYGLEMAPFDGPDGMFHSLQFSLTTSWSIAAK